MSRQLKIAIFHNLNQGGAYNQLRNQLKILKKHFQIDIYTTNPIDQKRKTDQYVDNIFFYKLIIPKHFVDFLHFIYFKLPKLHQKIATDINERNYDVILVQHDYLTKSPYLLRYLSGNTYYICCEPPREFYEISSYFYYDLKTILSNITLFPLKIIDRINVSKAKNIIANSKYTRHVIKKTYNRTSYLIYPGIIYKNNINVKNKRKKIFLSVGTINKVKGFDFLIHSLSKTKHSKKFDLHLVGYQGNYYNKLSKLAKEKGIKVHIHRNASEKKLKKLYLSSYMFLFASHKEPLGLVNLESMSYGLPSLAIDEGGVREVIPYNDLLVERNVEKYAKRIDYYVKNKLLTDKYRSKVKKYSKKWDYTKTTNELVKLIMNSS